MDEYEVEKKGLSPIAKYTLLAIGVVFVLVLLYVMLTSLSSMDHAI